MATFSARFESSSVAACAEALDSLATRAILATPLAVVRGASLIQGQARSNASHRPGPNVITGALRRSILVMGGAGPQAGPPGVALPSGPYRWSSIIAPTVIYGRIQELGGKIGPVSRLSRSGKGPGMLGWGGTGPTNRTHFAMSVTLPPRPYLAPAVIEKRLAVQQSFYDSWAAAWKAP